MASPACTITLQAFGAELDCHGRRRRLPLRQLIFMVFGGSGSWTECWPVCLRRSPPFAHQHPPHINAVSQTRFGPREEAFGAGKHCQVAKVALNRGGIVKPFTSKFGSAGKTELLRGTTINMVYLRGHHAVFAHMATPGRTGSCGASRNIKIS